MTVFEQLLLPSSYPPSLLHTWQHTLNNTIVCISDTIQSTPRLQTMYHKSRNSHQRRQDDGDPSLLVATFPCIFPPRLTSPPSPFTPQFPEELELTQSYLWVLLFNISFSKNLFSLTIIDIIFTPKRCLSKHSLYLQSITVIADSGPDWQLSVYVSLCYHSWWW